MYVCDIRCCLPNRMHNASNLCSMVASSSVTRIKTKHTRTTIIHQEHHHHHHNQEPAPQHLSPNRHSIELTLVASSSPGHRQSHYGLDQEVVPRPGDPSGPGNAAATRGRRFAPGGEAGGSRWGMASDDAEVVILHLYISLDIFRFAHIVNYICLYEVLLLG